MTCKEKFIADHPDWSNNKLSEVLNRQCPIDRYNVRPPLDEDGHEHCGGNYCIDCWNQEVPESNTEKEKNMINAKKTKSQLMDELEASENTVKDLKKQLKDMEKYKQYEDAGAEIKAIHTAFMASGFSDEQAFELIRISMLTAISNNSPTFNVDFSGLKRTVKR